MKKTLLILSCLALAGCSANYIRAKGPGSLNLSATVWTPGFNVTMDEGAEILIRRGGFADIMNGGDPTFEEVTEETGGVPPVLPQPDPE